MNDNQKKMKQRVINSAEEILQKQLFVSPIDLFVGMKLLQPIHVQEWRKGQIPYLERAIQGNLSKISFYMKTFREWAKHKGLKSSLTAYCRKTRGGNQELRFSISGNPEIEKSYQTHYISPMLSEIKEKKIQQKLENPPDLVATCSKCRKELFKGSIIYLEERNPLCLICAELDDLEYLPRGDALLTRRAKKYSVQSVVVVEFSRSRKRYERQGLLLDKAALKKAQDELDLEND